MSAASPDVSVSFDGRDPADVMLAKADAAIEGGASSIWLATHLFQRDPIATAGVLLGRHASLRIVLTALSPFVMHPVYIAMAAGTLNEMFPGRISLCLGVGAPVDLANAGIDATAPLAPMRETLRLCRALLSGATVDHDGARFQVRGQALSVGRQPVPLLLAASGPKMLRLAGDEADGVVLSAGASVEYMEWCVRNAVARPGCPVHAFVYTAAAEDAAAARDRMRRPLSMTLRGGHHARNLELAGSRLNQSDLTAAIAAGDHARAERMVDDDIVARHAAAGAPADVARRIAAYQAAGADEVVLAATRSAEEIKTVLAAAKL